MGGLIHWATGKAKGAWHDALALARTAYHYAKHLAMLLDILFGGVKTAWEDMVRAGLAVGRDLARLARASFVALRHIVNTLVPKAIRLAIGKLWHTVRGLVAKAIRELRHLISEGLRLAHKALAELKHLVAAEVRSIRHALSTALSLARKAYKLADEIANHPGAFAARLASHLFYPLLDWILAHSVTIIRYLLPRVVPIAKEQAHLIEGWISELL